MLNLDKVIKRRLEDGQHKVLLESYRVVENAQGGYLELVLKFEDRTNKWIVFPKQTDYVAGMLQRQFGLEDEDTVFKALLELAKIRQFDVWTSYNEQYKSRDYSLSKPAEEIDPATVVI